jgi:hypothetical protein
MDLAAEAQRLRETAEAKPLKLPVRRLVDDTHKAVTPDGLTVWFTIQVSAHARIHDVVFERGDRMPDDDETAAWLELLLPGRQANEAPSLPGSRTRHFEAFERDMTQAPIT